MSIDTWQWVSDLVNARQDALQERYAAELERAGATLLASRTLDRVYDPRGAILYDAGGRGATPAPGPVVSAPAAVRSVRDPTEAHLRALIPPVQQRAFALVRHARLAKLPVYISSSVRTQAQQDELVRRGASQRRDSLHLQGRAFDIDLVGYHRDRVPKRVWDWLGATGEALGLVWGGRWRTLRDFGHFEYPGFGGGGFRSGDGF